MARFARIADGLVAEILDLPDGVEIQDAVHPDLLSSFVPANDQVEAGWLWDGSSFSAPPPVVPYVPTQDDYSRAIQAHLDATAQERQYDSIQTAVSYRDDPNPQFAAEGTALFDWRSQVWTSALATLAAVQAGTEPAPTIDALIAGLPTMAWPA